MASSKPSQSSELQAEKAHGAAQGKALCAVEKSSRAASRSHGAADGRAASEELREGTVTVRDDGNGAARGGIGPAESAEVARVAVARTSFPPAVGVRPEPADTEPA